MANDKYDANIRKRVMEILIGIRKYQGLNGSAFAEKASLSQSTMLKVESKKIDPSMHVLKQYASALDIPFSIVLKYAKNCEEEIKKNGDIPQDTVRGRLFRFLMLEFSKDEEV